MSAPLSVMVQFPIIKDPWIKRSKIMSSSIPTATKNSPFRNRTQMSLLSNKSPVHLLSLATSSKFNTTELKLPT
jgi:hypothetical protein